MIDNRSFLNIFQPDAYVFPGGVIDKADYSHEWLKLYQHFGYSLDDLNGFSEGRGQRPPVFECYKDAGVIPDVAFRICAIREAFEECGLMLFKSSGNSNAILEMNFEDVASWRQKVHNNAFSFLELCRQVKNMACSSQVSFEIPCDDTVLFALLPVIFVI